MAFIITPRIAIQDPEVHRDIKYVYGTITYIPFILLYAYAPFYEINYDMHQDSPAYEAFQLLKNHRFGYFSVINLFLQLILLIVCAVDFLAFIWEVKEEIQTKIYKCRVYLFNSIIVPFTGLVVLSFWGLYLTNKEFIFPEEIFEAVSIWMFHLLHTVVILPILIEYWFFEPSVEIQKWVCFFIMSFVYWWYVLLCVSFYILHGQWLYPILNYMDLTTAFTYTIIAYLLAVIFMFAGVSYQNSRYVEPKNPKSQE